MLKLRFADYSLADKLVSLIERHGYSSTRSTDKGWIVISSAIDGAPRRALMKDWIALTLIDNDQKAQQQQGKLKI